MDTAVLEDMGLSNAEAKIYITLVELGDSKVGPIIEKSSLVSSVVHTNINHLVNKGWISYIKRGKIKIYKAIPPKNIINFLEERKKRVLEIIPELELKSQKSQQKEEAEIFEGINGIMFMLNSLLEDTITDKEYLFFASNIKEDNKKLQEFWSRYDAKRADKGLTIRGISPAKLKPYFTNRKKLKMKYTEQPTPSSLTIFNGTIALFSFGEKPIGYLIKSKEIYKIYKEYFEKLWNAI